MNTDASFLPPGTLCYLRGCVDDPALNGEVVEIVAGPTALDEPGTTWYEYTSAKVRELYGNAAVSVFALRRCLRPIAPGAGLPAEPRAIGRRQALQ